MRRDRVRKMKKLAIAAAALSLLALTAFTACAADAPVPASSGDAQLASGDWIAMATRYPIPDMGGKINDAPAPEVLASWWESFGDETLTQLIAMALENNRDLSTARSKVTEARASLGISKAAVLPWFDSTNYWTASRTPAEVGGSGSKIDVYKLGIDASWEIDIFGGKHQTIKANAADLEAQYASLNSAWVSLSAEIASDYVSLRTLQQRLAIARNNLALQKETYALVESRYKAGLTDTLALNQSKYVLEQTDATIPPLETSIEQVKNSLAILTGLVPGALEDMLGEARPIPQIDAGVMIGIPANALRQRPDIRAAERRLAAQLARKKAAKADLWPKFYLNGSIGTEALNTGSLFEGPNKLYSFGPQITFPIFHWGAIRNNIKVQTSKQEQALNDYEQTVLTAVGEVRNAVTAVLKERLRRESLARGADAAKAALAVASDKYKSGLVDFNNVIAAQQSLLSLSEQYAVSEGQITTDGIQLFKALGGGWAPLDAEAAAQAAKADKKKK